MIEVKYAELLDRLIQESGLTAKEISDKCKEQGVDITPSYISLLRNKDKNRIPSNDVSTALAKALGINADYLVLEGYMDSAPEILQSTLKRMYNSIVTLGFIASQLPVSQEQIDEYVEKQPIAEIIISLNDNMASILSCNSISDVMSSLEPIQSTHPLLAASDDAMSPIINKGDKINIDGMNTIANGDMVAISIAGDVQSVLCRKLQKRSDEILLLAYNREYETMAYDTDTIQILGTITSVTKAL